MSKKEPVIAKHIQKKCETCKHRRDYIPPVRGQNTCGIHGGFFYSEDWCNRWEDKEDGQLNR